MIKVLVEVEDGRVIGVYSNKDIQFVIVDKTASEIFHSDYNYSKLSDVFNDESNQAIKEELIKLNF